MIKIQINEKYVIEKPQGGNPFYISDLAGYRNNLITWGCKIGRKGIDLLEAELPRNITFDMIDFQTVMSCDDGKVTGFMPWVKMLPADLLQEVPVGVPNRMKTVVIDDTDPENIVTEEQVKTWDDWIGVNYTRSEIEGYVYFLSHSGSVRGASLSGAELVVINNLAYAELTITLPVVEELVL